MTRPALIAACATALVFSFHVTPVYGQQASPKPSQPKGHTTPAPVTTVPAEPLTPVQEKLAKNTNLASNPGDEDKARELFQTLDQAKIREDFVAAANYLKARLDCTGTIGAVGFCYGGGIVNMLATRLPDLAAAVPFYGNQPAADETAKIKAPLLIHYAENDDRINAGWPAYETALKANKVRYTMYKYPGTQHGFNNDTTPRYADAAAKLAWQRTIDFFNKELRG